MSSILDWFGGHDHRRARRRMLRQLNKRAQWVEEARTTPTVASQIEQMEQAEAARR